MRVKRHIGIYSGTFDPVHQGHITFAQETLYTCALDEIIFLPESQPREKTGVTGISKRVDIIQNALSDLPGLSVRKLSSDQFSTAATLPELQTIFPYATFTLLIGSDVVKTFDYRWENLDTLLNTVSLAVGIRDGDTSNDIIAIIDSLQKQYNLEINYTLISTVHSHVASSHIRNKLVS